jgi:3-dehydroquinate synthase
MEKVKVNLTKTEDKSYEIIIQAGILNQIPQDLEKEKLAYSYVIITDSTVLPLYGMELYKGFKTLGLNVYLVSFPAGEENKNRATKDKIEDEMSQYTGSDHPCCLCRQFYRGENGY